jgi:hypothetical protein
MMADRASKPELSWQMKMLLLIPKNLVYVFVAIILFAFGGMMYITYTEKNMTEFLTYNRTQEVIVVDPLFQKLQQIIYIDEYLVAEETDLDRMNHQRFNKDYMIRNRPFVMKGLAANWGATHKWKNFQYLKDNVGMTTSMLSVLNAKGLSVGEKPDWTLQRVKPHKVPIDLSKGLSQIENNTVTGLASADKDGKILQPVVYFYDDDMLRAPKLRNDYDFTWLHKFLRLQKTSLSVWPQVEH